MKKFSVRDLFWLVTLAAVLVSWWIDHRRITGKYDRTNAYAFISSRLPLGAVVGRTFRAQ
jgi:hypothetical protein